MKKNKIPYLTKQQMIEVDRLMIEVYGIQLVQMMETAGRQLARLSVERFLGGKPLGKKIVVLAGSGGNGGGALVCARILNTWGAKVEVVLSKSRDDYAGLILQQIEILESIPVQFRRWNDLEQAGQSDLILDGIIGYSLKGAPRGAAAEMIRWANDQESPILALDLPSGLDASTGEVFTPAIQASATLALALPKTGLRTQVAGIVGELYLADIGVPPALFASPSLDLEVGPIFHQDEIIFLTSPE